MTQPASTCFHCFRNDAMADNDATALAERIRKGEVSTQEVTAAAIERAKLAAPVINGVVAERYQQALTQSQHSKAQTGPFAGVPTYIKDNTNVKGLPTRHGSLAVPPRVADKTSPVCPANASPGLYLPWQIHNAGVWLQCHNRACSGKPDSQPLESRIFLWRLLGRCGCTGSSGSGTHCPC